LLKTIYPNGVQPDQYNDMLAMARIFDKLFRIATKKDAFGESPWRDVAGYGVIMAHFDELDREKARKEAGVHNPDVVVWQEPEQD
jgi:hypothetical protein